jgi:hypothetical protein
MTPADTCRLASTGGFYELPHLTTLVIERTRTGPRAGERVERWRYVMTALPSDWGTAYRLVNEESGEIYDVMLDGEDATCQCLGFLRHRFCKHCRALRALVKEGALR